MQVEAPQTREGAAVWDLAMRCGGQLRAVSGAVLGYDMTAVLNMGAALGVSGAAVVELFPMIEAAAVAAMNEAEKDATEERFVPSRA